MQITRKVDCPKKIVTCWLKDRTKEELLDNTRNSIRICKKAGFKINNMHADPEFNCIKEDLEQENEVNNVNMCPAKSRAPIIERCNRAVKERHRAIFHRLPCKMWLRAMIIRCIGETVMMLNAFPPAGGLNPEHSPRMITQGRGINYEKHCKIPFGQCVQAAIVKGKTNTPAERSVDAIKLRTLDNVQGGCEILDLNAGKKRACEEVIPLPVTEDIIKRVES